MATVNKLTVRHVNNLGAKSTEIFKTTIPVNLDSDTAVAVDTWARAFTALSTETYQDTEIQSTQSINEYLEELGG